MPFLFPSREKLKNLYLSHFSFQQHEPKNEPPANRQGVRSPFQMVTLSNIKANTIISFDKDYFIAQVAVA